MEGKIASYTARDALNRMEAKRNIAEYGTPYNPYTDSAARIHYLNAKFGERGWAKFLERIAQTSR